MNGQTNFGVLDYSQILELLSVDPYIESNSNVESNTEVITGKGGEKKETLKIRKKIVDLGVDNNYNIQQDWMPQDLGARARNSW